MAWLVPGWRLEKMIAVLRELPKAQRRRLLVPVPENARQALDELTGGARRGFHSGLAAWISERMAPR